MSATVLATDILPSLYDNDEDLEGTRESHEDVVDDLNYDVYNLVAFNYHPVRILGDEEEREEAILEAATRATQLLVKRRTCNRNLLKLTIVCDNINYDNDRLFECPVERSEIGPLAVLPTEKTVLPREKHVPEPKQDTKWEKFAKEKGIKNKKRERMVFEEDSQEFRPRFGYKRAKNGVEDMPIVEIKNGQDPFKDPWAEERKDKKARVLKNEKNQKKNIFRANGGPASLPPKDGFDPANTPGIPLDIAEKSAKRGKEGVRRALQLVQHSTASMGRFDEMRQGEPARKIHGKKRAFRDNNDASSHDMGVMKDQLRIVADKIDKKARGVTNSLAAYEGIIPDAPTDSFRQKKGKGKVAAQTARAASRVGKPRAGTVKGKRAGSMKKDKSNKQYQR